jgi:hypothetical protein
MRRRRATPRWDIVTDLERTIPSAGPPRHVPVAYALVNVTGGEKTVAAVVSVLTEDSRTAARARGRAPIPVERDLVLRLSALSIPARLRVAWRLGVLVRRLDPQWAIVRVWQPVDYPIGADHPSGTRSGHPKSGTRHALLLAIKGVSIWLDRRMATRGATRGERRRMPSYDPKSGKPYTSGTNFRPPNAVKLLSMCSAANLSVSSFLDRLVEGLEIDPETGLPEGWNNPQEVIEYTA